MCHSELTAPVSGGAGVIAEELAIDAGEQRIPSHLARPDQAGPAPGVLVFHDVNGPNDFYRDFASRLAQEGFVALLPDFFVRQGPPADSTREAIQERASRLDQEVALGDLALALDTLRQHPATSDRVGIIGFCMGGTFVMLAAAREPYPDAAVSFYGFPAGRKGWPLRPLDEASEVKSPLLMFVGDQDAGVGMDNVKKYAEALDAAERDYELVTYAGLPHGYMTFDSQATFYPESQDSWAKTIAFLRDRLAS